MTTGQAWVPCYEPWRHGGWYVTNISYPSGACGCVSRNYTDRKWRIVTENTGPGSPGDRTFPSRDAAAHAERQLAEGIIYALPAEGPIPCPRYPCGGEVVEQDRAVRWNTLQVVPRTSGSYLGASLGQADFETDRFLCDTCLGTVQLPPGTEESINYA